MDYALVSTTYAAQGKSAERVIGALDRHVGRESFYVAVSRVKRELRLYASEDLDLLIERMERSMAKENPSDIRLSDMEPSTKIRCMQLTGIEHHRERVDQISDLLPREHLDQKTAKQVGLEL